MKRTVIFAMLLTAAAVSAAGITKKFELSRNIAAVKAGEIVTTRLIFECEDDTVMGGWKTLVLRKHAPEAFFAKPEVIINRVNKTKTSPWDYILLSSDRQRFLRPLASGECPIRIETAGMPAGDYAIHIQCWMLKGKKSLFPAATFSLSITEGDNGKFAPTVKQEMPAASRIPRPAANAKPWYKSCTVKPKMPFAEPGEKIAYSCEFAALENEYITGYSVILLRREAAPWFFDRSDIKIKRRFPEKTDGYDSVTLVPFKNMKPVPEAKFDFELDTTGFPAGEYVLRLQLRLMKQAAEKSSYPVLLLPLSLR